MRFDWISEMLKALKKRQLPSLKLTWHLKMNGWNTSFLLGPGLFSRAFWLVSGSVVGCFNHPVEQYADARQIGSFFQGWKWKIFETTHQDNLNRNPSELQLWPIKMEGQKQSNHQFLEEKFGVRPSATLMLQGSLYIYIYVFIQPKQCTMNKGKSSKIAIQLHCLIPPPKKWVI